MITLPTDQLHAADMQSWRKSPQVPSVEKSVMVASQTPPELYAQRTGWTSIVLSALCEVPMFQPHGETKNCLLSSNGTICYGRGSM